MRLECNLIDCSGKRECGEMKIDATALFGLIKTGNEALSYFVLTFQVMKEMTLRRSAKLGDKMKQENDDSSVEARDLTVATQLG